MRVTGVVGIVFWVALCYRANAETLADRDSLRSDLSVGAVLRAATGEGVGFMYRRALGDRWHLRARVDVLLAKSNALGEYNYLEVRPGGSYEVPVRKVVMYFGVDGFYGYFREAVDTRLASQQVGACGIVGLRSYPVFHHLSIGMETGPKVGYRFRRSERNASSWDNHTLNDLFVYLIFRL